MGPESKKHGVKAAHTELLRRHLPKSPAMLLLGTLLFSLFVNVLAVKRRPLVVWHGLGDSHSSPGMLEFFEDIKDVHPGIFIHSVWIEEKLDDDRKAGFYGNVDEQIEFVANQLQSIEELQGGFDAIGFSQGGQFLRAYAERYNHILPIYNLITFGSQHMGISDLPLCSAVDLLCQLARRAAKRAVYGDWAQKNLIQAQYFRDPKQLPKFLESNRFLTSLNNELPDDETRNDTYAHNLARLNNLVLVLFQEDRTVVPKESSWFGSEAPPPEEIMLSSEQTPLTMPAKAIIPMRLQPLYTEDWIGLKTLDEAGGVVFATCPGEHMHIGDCWEPLVREYTGALLD